ncbi:MAG: hypothetical protein JO152_07115 [Mycobacteriaceae bacterium]|nr:hypothetical protein [Mycobacteriaceae bacterium]
MNDVIQIAATDPAGQGFYVYPAQGTFRPYGATPGGSAGLAAGKALIGAGVATSSAARAFIDNARIPLVTSRGVVAGLTTGVGFLAAFTISGHGGPHANRTAQVYQLYGTGQDLQPFDLSDIIAQLVTRAGTDPSILQVGRVVPVLYRGQPADITMTQFLIDQVVRQLPVKQLPGMANRDP